MSNMERGLKFQLEFSMKGQQKLEYDEAEQIVLIHSIKRNDKSCANLIKLIRKCLSASIRVLYQLK